MMNYVLLLVPVIFSAAAQLLVKQAANYAIKSTNWLIIMGISILSYGIAFIIYSFAVRNFPISIASPINTILVMIVVVVGGSILGEVISIRQAIGVLLGVVSVVLILAA